MASTRAGEREASGTRRNALFENANQHWRQTDDLFVFCTPQVQRLWSRPAAYRCARPALLIRRLRARRHCGHRAAHPQNRAPQGAPSSPGQRFPTDTACRHANRNRADRCRCRQTVASLTRPDRGITHTYRFTRFANRRFLPERFQKRRFPRAHHAFTGRLSTFRRAVSAACSARSSLSRAAVVRSPAWSSARGSSPSNWHGVS